MQDIWAFGRRQQQGRAAATGSAAAAATLVVLLATAPVHADDAAECISLQDADSCDRATVRDPGRRLVFREARGNTYFFQGDYARAANDFSGLLAEAALAAEARLRILERRAALFERLGDRERAIADYRQALVLASVPGSPAATDQGPEAIRAALSRLGAVP